MHVVAVLCIYRPIGLLGDGWGRGTVNEEGEFPTASKMINRLSLKVLIILLNTYFKSIIEWLPEALGLYRIKVPRHGLHFNWSELESVITLFNTYFESITEWRPEALGLYKIIFDTVYGSQVLSLLLDISATHSA